MAGCNFLGALLAGALAAAVCANTTGAAPAKPPGGKHALNPKEALTIGTEAYIFGYPLVSMDMTRRVMTNVREPDAMRAPPGQFARMRTFPLAASRDVTMPNADTLVITLWLDVSREPWVVSLPDTKGHYCVFSFLDGWTTVFAAPGTRSTGTGPQQCAITGPGWKGKLPPGVKQYKSSTGLVRMLGRIYCTGTPEDCAAVHALQDQCSAMPLSAYGKPFAPLPGLVDPGVDMKRTVREQVKSLGVATYFNYLALLMKNNPPAHADRTMVKKLARLGIIPGQPFDIGALPPPVIQVLEGVPGAALAKMAEWPKATDNDHDWSSQNGWMRTVKTGIYGTDYIQRALIAALALGASRPEDTLAAVSTVDGAGKPYSGSSSYLLHFPPHQAPSANAFWSLTIYDGDYFFVENPLGRHSLNARDQLRYNPDGSLDLCIQKYPPGLEKEANWLPAPAGKFTLMFRFYWPKPAFLSSSWQCPPVKRGD